MLKPQERMAEKLRQRLGLGLFVLYDSFSWLTAGLRGCTYLLTASNSRHCITRTSLIQPLLMLTFQRTKGIVAAQKRAAPKNYSHGI